MICTARPTVVKRRLLQLGASISGIALMEFALILPIFLLVAICGIETANYAITRMTMSQLALRLADNASRMGSGTLLAAKSIDERDINNVLDGTLNQAKALGLKEKGRLVLSSLQVNPDNGQWIAWQRCSGDRVDLASHYGKAGDGASGTSLTGIGPASAKVAAQPGSAVMFVELQYQYQPVFPVAQNFLRNEVINYTAAFVVREDRDLTTISNSSNLTIRQC